MKKNYLTILILFLCVGISYGGGIGNIFTKSPTSYVNPIIGTGEIPEAMGGGHTYPGVGYPFGMTQWTAQTNIHGDWGVPYYYEDGVIQGIRGTHYPSGSCMDDYGAVTVMPIVGELKVDPEVRASKFSHDNEIAKPYYYKVLLDDYGITSEHTATNRCAIFQFTYPKSDESYILVSPTELVNSLIGEGYVKINMSNNEVVGYNSKGGGWRNSIPSPFAGYFVAKFDRKFSNYGTWNSEKININSTEAKGTDSVGAFVKFSTKQGDKVKLKVCSSFIDVAQARDNMAKEIPSWDMDEVINKTKKIWDDQLNKIAVRGGSKEQKTIFYTSLYHAMLLPREFSEYGRYYSPFDGKIHQGVYYDDFSMWDTFRAEHPLLTILEPERSIDMIKTLISMYEEGGWIPKWPNPYYSNDMIGTHSDSIITDAYLKGLRDFDINRAYEGMYKHATVEVTREMWDETPFEGRPMLNLYKEMGYIPADVQSNVGRKRKEQVSQTLEYAYDDWCLAQLAKALGKNSDHEMFLKRSKNYINVFDKSVGFVRGRTKAGDWVEPFDPKEHYDYLTEGNPWQYSWFAPQDIEGLINLMGGPELFVNKLDEFFQSGQYWHGNEPSHHIVYLYNYAGAPWKTQERVREIMGSEYKLIPAGLSGNDDAGQMSAWYVFSAMGFYPVTPGSNLYSIGTPLFDEVTIKLDDYYDNNKFRIIAINNSENNKYIQRAFLNGRLLDSPFISHEDIVKGGNLIFIMGSNPNKNWGVK